MSGERTPFVELNRRFRPLEQTTDAEENARASYRSFLGNLGALSWEEILKWNRVVVLGEAGSGKTEEFRNRTKLLNETGEVAFLIRLDRLATEPMDAVLNSEQLKSFEKWKRDSTRGVFFLDSVDEAKFRRISDFYTALDRFRDEMGDDTLARSKIILSSRISEWQVAHDAYEFNQRFPAHDGDRKDSSEQRLLVVQLEPLDEEQVRRFALAQGVSDLNQFTGAIERAHAWEFNRRPLDVLECLNYWNEHGKLGSLTQLIESDVRLKLRPRPVRDEHPLADEEARSGAEWLAAASIFARKFVFKIPDDEPLQADALDPYLCLPSHWTREQCRALLARALFDGATYGRIRFHHRSIAEYLAARWLKERMDAGCPGYELERILTIITTGERLIRPALAPVTAWLCYGEMPWNQSVRKWILEADPTVHLLYGDPSQLPVDYRCAILRALSERAKKGRRQRLETTPEALSRLADPALSTEITNLILDTSLFDDLRIDLLGIVRYGRLAGCLNAVLALVADKAASDRLKTYAVSVIEVVGGEADRKSLAEITNSMIEIDDALCARIASATFPTVISSSQLVDLLRKIKFGPVLSIDVQSYLSSHFRDALVPDDAHALLKELLALARLPPLSSHNGITGVLSDRFSWICGLLPPVLKTLLKKTSLSPEESDSAGEAIWLLEHFRQQNPLHDVDLKGVPESTFGHPEVRRAYFWRVVCEMPKQTTARTNILWLITNPQSVLSLGAHDFCWLLDDVTKRSDPDDAILALQLAVEIWISRGRTLADRRRILKAIDSRQHLLSIFRSAVVSTRFLGIKRFWWSRFRNKLTNAAWWRFQIRRATDWWNSLHQQLNLVRGRRFLASGEATDWLAYLLRDVQKDGRQLTPKDWSSLEKKRGKLIAHSVKQGCKSAWRGFMPELPHEKIDPSTIDCRLIVGLAGIQASLEDGELTFETLTDEDAERAGRYAVNELNGFSPWFKELAKARPTSVTKVLSSCVEGEWHFPEERRGHEVMHDLAWHGMALLHLVRERILTLLQAGDPRNHSILRYALVGLAHRQDPPIEELAEMAAKRISTLNDPVRVALWSAIWLQIDADAALAALQNKTTNPTELDNTVVLICAMLAGEYLQPIPLLRKPDYMRPEILAQFIPFIYSHVRTADDVHRAGKGVFSPGPRDYAQRYRSILIQKLGETPSADAEHALQGLVDNPIMLDVRDWILDLLDERRRKAANLGAWTPEDLHEFAKHHEVGPKNDSELFEIARKRLLDVKNDLERADNSLRRELHKDYPEADLRKWLQRKLSERSRNRYTVPQETEIDLQERPDLRVERPGLAPVSIEVKWVDKRTLSNLLEGLETQLLGKYLRAFHSRYGIYVLGIIKGKDYWVDPDHKERHLSFAEVVGIITEHARHLVRTHAEVSDIEVISLDFREPARKAQRASRIASPQERK